MRILSASNRPELPQRLLGRVVDIVGLYLDLPDKSMVLFVVSERAFSTMKRARFRHWIAASPPGHEKGSRRDDTRLQAQWHDHSISALNMMSGEVLGERQPRH